MFTGLVQALGTVRTISAGAETTRFEIDLGAWDHVPDLGASIAVNGCCLTVVAVGGGSLGERRWLAFDAIQQTLSVTALGDVRVGDRVNLEHAATPTTFLGGHVVLGHVDAIAVVRELLRESEWRVRLGLPSDLARYVVEKGSIALDGVSLTIARVADTADETQIDVCLIPETLARTTLRDWAIGTRVHVEADYLAKLVMRQIEWVSRR